MEFPDKFLAYSKEITQIAGKRATVQSQFSSTFISVRCVFETSDFEMICKKNQAQFYNSLTILNKQTGTYGKATTKTDENEHEAFRTFRSTLTPLCAEPLEEFKHLLEYEKPKLESRLQQREALDNELRRCEVELSSLLAMETDNPQIILDEGLGE